MINELKENYLDELESYESNIQSINNTIRYFDDNFKMSNFNLDQFRDNLLALTWYEHHRPNDKLWGLNKFKICCRVLEKYKHMSTSNKHVSYLLHDSHIENDDYMMEIINGKTIHSLVPYQGYSNPNNEYNEGYIIFNESSYRLNLSD